VKWWRDENIEGPESSRVENAEKKKNEKGVMDNPFIKVFSKSLCEVCTTHEVVDLLCPPA
jgi:hypothetical protein